MFGSVSCSNLDLSSHEDGSLHTPNRRTNGTYVSAVSVRTRVLSRLLLESKERVKRRRTRLLSVKEEVEEDDRVLGV